MALTRGSVTVASRIMLPVYLVAVTAMGLIYTLDPGHRVARAHALTIQRAIMHGSMVPWGCLFLGLAVGMLLAFISSHRGAFCLALAVCSVTQAAWGGMYAASAVSDHAAGFMPIVYSFVFSAACFASMMSLLRGEVQ